MGIGRVKMIVRWIRASTGAEAAAIFFRHARGDGRVILDDVSVAIDNFMFCFWHRLPPAYFSGLIALDFLRCGQQ
jgi:hypothetical protein